MVTCAENDQVAMAVLLFGTASPTRGVVDDLEYLVARLRAVWPDVRIIIRADSGFAVPGCYEACERLRLIKVAAEIVVSTRRVLVRLSGSWPFLKHYQAVSAAVNEACARLAPDTS